MAEEYIVSYKVGDVVCLWDEKVEHTGVIVLKEVLVTITGVKTSVPGEFSGTPVSATSLIGIGDDGKTYDKHWDRWPESQTECFTDKWSMRDDGEGDFPCWYPKEACHAYNSLQLHNKQHPEHQLTRSDRNGKPILPKGDVEYCEEHDRYQHKGTECFHCLVEKRRRSA